MRRSMSVIVPREIGPTAPGRSLQRDVYASLALGTWPEDAPLRLVDGQVVDARLAPAHETVLIELPQLVAVAAPPLAVAVVALVLEAHGDAIDVERPQALAQRVLQL